MFKVCLCGYPSNLSTPLCLCGFSSPTLYPPIHADAASWTRPHSLGMSVHHGLGALRFPLLWSFPGPHVLWSGSIILSSSQGGLEHVHALKLVHDHSGFQMNEILAFKPGLLLVFFKPSVLQFDLIQHGKFCFTPKHGKWKTFKIISHFYSFAPL